MSAGSTLFWSGVLLVGVAMAAPRLGSVDSPVAAPQAEAPSPRAAAAPARTRNGVFEHALVRSPDGHFYAEAQVNGAHIRFMVDTGATIVALTREDAQRAGIPLGPERALARGLGGEVEVVPVMIERVSLGALEARGVPAAVVEDLPISLLGQSFLSQVGSVRIEDDRMVLR